MITAARCTLPIMQLVCNLVASGTSSNVTEPALHQSSLQLQSTHLPDGYVAYPEFAAYKVYNQLATLMEAKNLCAQEGARLAVIDSFEKLEYLSHQMPSSEWVHGGIIRMDLTWINVNTGFRVLSIPSIMDKPYDPWDCVFLRHSASRLENRSCSTKSHFVCEFPILVNSTIGAN